MTASDTGNRRRSEELDHLVRSLDDLDREFEAGDLDQTDYDTLRNDYTVRIADEMKRRSGRDGERAAATGSRLQRWLMITAAVAVFAVGAGWLVARSAGERGVADGLTGSVNAGSAQKNMECQQMGAQGELLDSLQCFDDILAEDPENVQALTYRGWYLYLAASSMAPDSEDAADQGADAQDQRVELLASAMTYLDQAVEVDPTFPDAHAFRAVAFDRLGLSAEACAEVETLLALDPPPFYRNQVSGVADRNGCPIG